MRKRGAPTRLGSAARARSPSSSGPQWPARAVRRQRRRPGCAGCWMMRKPSRPPERRGESTCALKAVEWAWLDRGSVVQPPWQHDLHGLSAGGFYRALSACWSACRHRPTRSAAAARCAARPPPRPKRASTRGTRRRQTRGARPPPAVRPRGHGEGHV